LIFKYNKLQVKVAPSPDGEAGVRRIKSKLYLLPLIQPSPSGEGF